MDMAQRMATGAEPPESAFAPPVQGAVRHDAARGIPRAEEEDVVRRWECLGHIWSSLEPRPRPGWLGIRDDVVDGRPIALDVVWLADEGVVRAPLLVQVLHECRDDLVLAGRIFPHGGLS